MRRVWALLAAVWLLLSAAARETGSARGEETAGAAAQALAEKQITELIREQAGQAGPQAWADTALAEASDGLGGWYLIALRRLESIGYGIARESWDRAEGEGLSYARALAALEKKAAEEKGGITKRERMALTLQALGGGEDFVRETEEAAVKETTLMPLVFALHLMNNGALTGNAAREEIAARLRALQLADGGWAVIGDAADVDCTAMVLQALAPLRQDPETGKAVERGVEALAAIQLENGGFTGMGMESAESSAQVLLALSCLGIDAAADERFLKNGASVLDAVMRFRTEGGFAHDPASGKMNDTATVQCFYALTGYAAMRRGSGPYYVFDFPPVRRSGAELPLKAWLYLASGALVLAGWAAALIRKKRNWRSYAFPLLAGSLIALAVSGIEIQSPEGYYGQESARRGEANLRTRISIRCDSVAGENEYAPADGVILAEQEILLAEGETAYDQLLEATRKNRIQMEYDGTTAGAYVRGIGYLYEYAFGSLSGWMYRVNGVYADVGCSQLRLRDGDLVEWVYTRNLGRDE